MRTSLAGETYARAYARGWEPEPELTVSQWADEHRVLSQVGAAEPGQWRTSRTPYLREIMDLLSVSNPTTELCFQKAAQLGATDGLAVNFIGYVIHHAPGPVLLIQPTLEMLKKVSKQRIAPAIADSPELFSRVGETRERDSGNTIFSKEFPGGILLMATANSASGLRMMPIRFLIADEVDGYPGDVGGEGDPIEIARKRTVTYRGRRKCVYFSTPKDRGTSRIEKLYNASDRRRYFIPCPECGHMDFLTWSGYSDFVAGKDGGHHSIGWDEGQPESAHMVCGGCRARIPESRKVEMVERGEWRATEPGPGRMPGFHLSALYSLIGQSWTDLVDEFEKVKGDPPLFRVWVNTVLGETWEERSNLVADVDMLLARREVYPSTPEPELLQLVPNGVGVIVGAIDVQKDRLEWKLVGYGAGEESWVLAAGVEAGDPETEGVWLEVDRQLLQPLRHESGREVLVTAVAVDTRFCTEQAYRFCAARVGRDRARTLGIRGGQLAEGPIAGTPSRLNSYHVPVWTLCTATAKERIYARLGIQAPGPGFMHFPEWIDREYLEQLTAEKVIRKWVNGRPQRIWHKKRDRNEQLDLEVYCLAALHILGPQFIAGLGKLAAGLSEAIQEKPAASGQPQLAPRRKTWLDGWR